MRPSIPAFSLQRVPQPLLEILLHVSGLLLDLLERLRRQLAEAALEVGAQGFQEIGRDHALARFQRRAAQRLKEDAENVSYRRAAFGGADVLELDRRHG